MTFGSVRGSISRADHPVLVCHDDVSYLQRLCISSESG